MTHETIDARLTETVLDETLVYDGSLLKVRRMTVRLPDGRQAHRETIRHPGASAIVTLDADGRIVLERQWRAPAGGAFWEIPAGKIDPGEDPLETARRELIEEAGVSAARWTHLGTIHNAIGYSDEHIEIYLARDLTPCQQRLDENEFLTLVSVPMQEAFEMTRNGAITDVKTLIGLGWLRDYLDGSLSQAKEMA
jgi:ADP-ribose pyrophosphatase